MSDSVEVRSAVDAVWCFYLAGVAEREGHEEAARRLRAKATEWTEKSLSGLRRAARAGSPGTRPAASPDYSRVRETLGWCATASQKPCRP
jgi:hypothetical protein